MKVIAVSLAALLILAVAKGEYTVTNDTNSYQWQRSQAADTTPAVWDTWEEDDYSELPARGMLFMKCFENENAVTSRRKKTGKKTKKCKKLMADTVKVTNTKKKASCDRTYQLGEGAMVRVKLPSDSPTCDVLLTAGRNAQLDVRCPRFRLGPRQQELLFLTPGDTLGWVYDSRQRPSGVDGQKQLYLLYTRRQESVPRGSGVTCLVEATESKQRSEETGRSSRAEGQQIRGCSTKCGLSAISMRQMRIVGGSEAAKGEFPWMVRLEVNTADEGYTSLCGGSILTDTLILTAAHCLHNVVSVTVFVGMHDRTEVWNSETQVIPVWGAIIHPLYDNKTYVHDIALLVLAEKIQWMRHVRPVCLAPRHVVQDGSARRLAMVSGWGATRQVMKGGSSQATGGSPVLRKVTLAMVSHSDCSNMYRGLITKYQICAAAPGKDSCQGDSGGPLIVRDKNIWYQAGIVSIGFGCADPKYAGVYTRVSEHTDWILSHATGSC